MPKLKTHRGAAKRFKVTGGGKLVRRRSMHSHMLTKKTTKRKRRLRKGCSVAGKFASNLKRILHK